MEADSHLEWPPVLTHRIEGIPGSGYFDFITNIEIGAQFQIDLLGYVRVLHESGYAGPVDLEVIGAREYELERCCTIAAEARGHMQACLQACGAR